MTGDYMTGALHHIFVHNTLKIASAEGVDKKLILDYQKTFANMCSSANVGNMAVLV